MTVQAQDSVQYYDGPINVGAVIPITDFTFIDNSHVSVKIRGEESIWEYGVDYTVAGANTVERTVTINRAVSEGQVLAVYLDVPITQGISPEEGGNFPASTQEFTLDKLTYICQMLFALISRSLQVSIDTPFNGTLLNLDQNKGAALIVNDTGNGITYSQFSVADLEYIANRLYASITNIDTVANNILKVNTVSANNDNITITADNNSNISTVANSILDVNSVAANLTDLATIVANLATLLAVYNDLENIDAARERAQSAANSAALAEEWAISQNLVANTDRSSKYYANQAKQYAQSLRANGLIWKAISSTDWTLNQTTNKYEYTILKTELPIILGAVKGTWYNNTYVSNLNIIANNTENKLISLEPFTGLVLGALTVLNSEPLDTVATEQAAIAQQQALLAEEWATKLSGLVEDLDYSAKYYAQQAATSETNAANSASAASSSATNAATSETNAANSASAASLAKAAIDAMLESQAFVDVTNNLNNISTVSTNIANVNIAADNIGDINTVSDNIEDVIAVAASLGDITNVVIFNNDVMTPNNGKVIWTITHELNSNKMQVAVYNNSGNEVVKNTKIISNTQIQIELLAATTVAANTYKAVLIGGK